MSSNTNKNTTGVDLAEDQTTDSAQQPSLEMADNIIISDDAQMVYGQPEQSLFSTLITVDHTKNVSLKDYFERPVVFARGQLSQTDGPNTFPVYSVIRETLKSTLMWNERLRGYYGFRGDLVVRIQFNASPFQQGRYFLFHQPTMGYTAANAKVKAHMFSRTQLTQLPHVEFDLSCETSAELVIPYISDVNYFAVNQLADAYNSSTYYEGEVGVFGIRPYIPLNTGPAGTTTCSYTIWVSWRNPQFYVSVVPQSGLLDREKKQVQDNPGQVTQALSKVSKSMNILSEIPVISTFSGPASWVADVLSRAANVWGWSKPTASNYSQIVLRQSHTNHFNSDGSEFTHKAAIFAENRVDIMPEFSPNKVDELDVVWLASKPAYFTQFNWEDVATESTQLWLTNVNYAGYFNTHSPVNSVTTYSILPLSTVARHFAFGRGGIVFKFKMAKTQFHSGRLQITFVPRARFTSQTAVAGVDDPTADYAYRTVIDVREGHEFTVVCPYVRAEPFTSVSDNWGQLSVRVLDVLRRPETAASSITVVVEVAAAPDIAFAVENNTVFRPTVVDAQFQSGLVECDLLESGVGNTSIIRAPNILAERAVMGESVRSFRSLLRRWAFYRNVNGNLVSGAPPAAVTPPSAVVYHYYPESFTLAYLSPTTYWPVEFGTIASLNRFTTSPLDLFQSMFLSSRGSYRYRFAFPFIGNERAFAVVETRVDTGLSNRPDPVRTLPNAGENLPLYGSVTGTAQPITNAIGSHDFTKISINGEYSIEMPPYNGKFARASNAYWNNTNTVVALTNDAGNSYNLLKLQTYQGDIALSDLDTTPMAFKSVGEDYCLHYFVSIIPSTS